MAREVHPASLRKEVNNFLEKKRRNEALVCIEVLKMHWKSKFFWNIFLQLDTICDLTGE